MNKKDAAHPLYDSIVMVRKDGDHRIAHNPGASEREYVKLRDQSL